MQKLFILLISSVDHEVQFLWKKKGCFASQTDTKWFFLVAIEAELASRTMIVLFYEASGFHRTYIFSMILWLIVPEICHFALWNAMYVFSSMCCHVIGYSV